MDQLIFDEDKKNLEKFLSINNEYNIQYIDEEMKWRGSLEYYGKKFFFDICYISLYPYYPPKFFCYTNSSFDNFFVSAYWAGHQYIDHSICLFTKDSGESKWKSSYRLDKVLGKFKVMIEEIETGKISREHTSLDYRIEDYAQNECFYLNQNLKNKIYEEHLINIEFVVILPKFNFIRFNPKIYGFFQNPMKKRKKFFNTRKANIIYLNKSDFTYIKDNLLKKENCLKILEKYNIHNQFGLIFQDQLMLSEDSENSFVFFLHFFNKGNKIDYVFSIVKISGFFETIYKRQADLGIKSLKNLSNVQIIVIGLGTLGAKITSSLLRNGIKKLIYYDPDIYEPENVLRGVSSITTIGSPKSIAITETILNIYPKVQFINRFGTPLDPLLRMEFLTLLKQSDLVICCLDNEIDEYEIHKTCYEKNIPLISSICLDNARFGRIYRVIPEKTPCISCINHFIKKEPYRYPSLIQKKEKINLYQQPGIPGINLDINEIANKTVRFAFQTLAENNDIDDFFSPVPYHHFLYGNYIGWIFEKPGMMTIQDFSKWENCPLCGDED
ncbi:ThiF family adenylyltransferase [Candidatus Lokiarchaeum ossiferum]|uniref:ThiF family adenylyltransferase n=1 Tax=Candidatus Lokiarchaeum ossiferum TaxID=2951803 RepID=UPI00352DD3E0